MPNVNLLNPKYTIRFRFLEIAPPINADIVVRNPIFYEIIRPLSRLAGDRARVRVNDGINIPETFRTVMKTKGRL
jgi:hypothetical protein